MFTYKKTTTIIGLAALSTLVASSTTVTDDSAGAKRLGRRNIGKAMDKGYEREDLNGRRQLGKKKKTKVKKTKVPKATSSPKIKLPKATSSPKTKAPKATSSPKAQKSGKSSKAEGALYHAGLGTYGEFYLHVTDQGTMTWVSDLADLNKLPYFDGASNIPDLGYHLYNRWDQSTNSTFEDTKAGCAPVHLGGHYDPYVACGPDSAQPDDRCIAVHGGDYSYACSYEDSCFSTCEVGDLSGKYGPLVVDDYGSAHSVVEHDPFPALTCHYDATGEENDPFKFASVVFHAPNGDRVLCGKLEPVEGAVGAVKRSKGGYP